jgi:hydrogenase maturation protein HypF
MGTERLPTLQRQRLHVRGIVQGVGFRPFVYALAQRHGLAGFVGNDSSGVFIEVEGTAAALAAFGAGLRGETPPLAVIESVEAEPLATCGDDAFVIVTSAAQAGASTLVSPDMCICDDCLRELFDPANRRHRYPFINCTNCGPRFTIIKDVPYDRPLTTMRDFALCPACAREYHDPSDRRFHAQPNACPVCGPRVWFERGAALAGAPAFEDINGEDPIAAAQRALACGLIVAVKGIGGFHLACDARNATAVARLRARKGRVDKPFAVMARDLSAVSRFAWVDEDEARMLTSRARPIVLLSWRAEAVHGSPVRDVSPGNDSIGVMLPYTPLHYLLIGDAPLVMTSGNLSDEPICKDNADAHTRLSGLADAFLLHNRDIHVWCDDSVVRVFRGQELPVRRSRGYAPYPVRLPSAGPTILATGGELKATFCLARGDHAYLSQHIGDMGNLETLDAFERAFDHMRTLFRATPEIVASDMHPGYLSTQWAERYAEAHGVQLRKVQHHHAHIASVMAEHGCAQDQRVIGISFDGTGYGLDGATWGGETLLCGYAGFERLAQLRYVPLPGGDAAVKRPYRSALAHLWAAGIAWDDDLPCVRACPPAELRVLRQQLERNLNCVPTSSMGRLFDAIAALLGVRQSVSYEAQAAIEMEALAARSAAGAEMDIAQFTIEADGGVDPAPLLRGLVAGLRAGQPPAQLAVRAHQTVAHLVLTLGQRARDQCGLNAIALSGGVFQNVLLLDAAVRFLQRDGFDVMWHAKVPPNDGGLALGQAAIARALE